MEKEYYVVLVNTYGSKPSVFKYNTDEQAVAAANALINPPTCIAYIYEGRCDDKWYGEAKLIAEVKRFYD